MPVTFPLCTPSLGEPRCSHPCPGLCCPRRPLPHISTTVPSLSPNAQVEQRLISAGILRADGAVIDLEEDEEEGGEWGVYNEIEVSDGEEACRILEERLGFDQVGVHFEKTMS